MTTPQPIYGRFTEDHTPEPAMNWRDRSDEAIDLIRRANGIACERDNVDEQRRLRRNALQDAMDQITLAIEDL